MREVGIGLGEVVQPRPPAVIPCIPFLSYSYYRLGGGGLTKEFSLSVQH